MNLEWVNNIKNQSNLEVWITKPSPHGNGGWCGDRACLKTTLKEALNINPYSLEPSSDYDHQWDCEFNGEYRISTKPNSNYGIYIFGRDYKWEKIRTLLKS